MRPGAHGPATRPVLIPAGRPAPRAGNAEWLRDQSRVCDGPVPGPLGFCAHHYDTNFAALVLAGCDPHQAHREPETPRWIGTHHEQDPGTDIYQQDHERQEAARLADGPARMYAVPPRQPVTRAQENRARLVAALAGGPVPLLIGILALAGGTGLAALASEKRAAAEKAAAASTSADS